MDWPRQGRRGTRHDEHDPKEPYMQVRSRTLAGAAALTIALAAPSGAALAHTVQPGETLWSLAATQGQSAADLAAHNGLDEDAPLVAGTEIDVPVAAAPAPATFLTSETLDPAFASDNVRTGVIFLGQLLADSGGDEVTAVAGYYQGAASVASEGLYPETQQYVDNVMALRSEFGG